jgi:hypothetical protein
MSMKHPTPEELVSWVYGETNNKQLSAHVKECAECRAQTETWRGIMKTLDDLPAPAARRRFAWAPVQWAAAAALFLLLGIITGRFAFSTDEAKLRAAVQSEMQQQIAAMRTELTQDFEAALQQARAEDRAAYLLALKELNAKYEMEVAALKRGLETVVAVADYEFQNTQEQLAQLAATAQNSPQP